MTEKKVVAENPDQALLPFGCDLLTQQWILSVEETNAMTRVLLKGFAYALGSALFAAGMYQSYGNPGLCITAGFGVVGLAVKGIVALANRRKAPTCDCV